MATLRGRILLVVLAFGLSLTAVAGSTAQSEKPTVTIGSKDFTEQELVNEMLALLLEDAGYNVERKLNLGGSALVQEALVSGQIDAYIEYTGTGLLVHLGMQLPTAASTPTADAAGATPTAMSMADTVFEIVKREYKAQFNLVWLDPLGFNNTYALAMTQEKAAELGVTKISDLIGKADNLKFGGSQEFLTRPDGLPGLTAAYPGLKFAEERGMDPGLMYGAVDSGDLDVIAAFATDGRIPSLGLVTLEDDLGFFPPYFAAPVVRQELLDEDPGVADVLNKLAGKIDDATMAGLNLQVDEGGQEAQDVGRAFLQEQGLIQGS